jgi:hypothetical protein
MESIMECNFCHQDVPEPCRNADMVHARAVEHVERCEDADKTEGREGGSDVPGLVIPPITHQ